MQRKDIRISSSSGGTFDCYFALPDAPGKVPAIVLASAVHGVDHDLRAIADDFAARGFVAAAPDLFWRTIPGPLARGDDRTSERSKPRKPVIALGEGDLKDTLAALKLEPQFNGRAAVIGFCFGGPYAIIGPKRLGFEAGISCHGSAMLDFIHEIEGVTAPVCIVWGDNDHGAPVEVLDAYRALSPKMANVEVKVFPGVQHGFMMKEDPRFDATASSFSMDRTVELLGRMR
jgi:carboxymethylenebutenolidase